MSKDLPPLKTGDIAIRGIDGLKYILTEKTKAEFEWVPMKPCQHCDGMGHIPLTDEEREERTTTISDFLEKHPPFTHKDK